MQASLAMVMARWKELLVGSSPVHVLDVFFWIPIMYNASLNFPAMHVSWSKITDKLSVSKDHIACSQLHWSPGWELVQGAIEFSSWSPTDSATARDPTSSCATLVISIFSLHPGCLVTSTSTNFSSDANVYSVAFLNFYVIQGRSWICQLVWLMGGVG
jgi:hypothetical protein